MEENKRSEKRFYVNDTLKIYLYFIIVGILLVFNISYSLSFFVENRVIQEGVLTIGDLSYTIGSKDINATSLAPKTDALGISDYIKTLTLNNTSGVRGEYTLTLNRTSGLNLSDLRYALLINDVIMAIDDMPNDGIIYESAFLPNETINIELRLWVKNDYAGSETTFVGSLDEDVSLGKMTATDYFDGLNTITNNNVLFNCDNGTSCENWKIVKIENGHIVITHEDDYENASLRTNSKLFDANMNYHDDNDLVVSLSTDEKNVYLDSMVLIKSGNGTSENPFIFENGSYHQNDEKVKCFVGYNNGIEVIIQPVYLERDNYISKVNSYGWSDGNSNVYYFGESIGFTTNVTLNIVDTLNTIIERKVAQNVSYVKSYSTIMDDNSTFKTQDTYNGADADKLPVYYYSRAAAIGYSNVLMGGYCWKIVRTTDNGGVKLLYNGLAENNECGDNRANGKGMVIKEVIANQPLNSTLLYSDSFTYDESNGTFTLVDYDSLVWSDSTYSNIIGKWTCLDGSNTCNRIYHVGVYINNTNGTVSGFEIDDNDNNTSIAKSIFNDSSADARTLGYMYNGVGKNVLKELSGTFAHNVSWNGSSYDLDSDTSTTIDATHHYICTDNTCTSVYYSYYLGTDGKSLVVELSNGKKIENYLKETLNYKQNDNEADWTDINLYNSTIKGVLENWYKNKLLSFDSLIDKETVYCNNRKITSLGGWSINGALANDNNSANDLLFQKEIAGNLDCQNMTDRFSNSTSNTLAKTAYPIGLITEAERYLLDASYIVTPYAWWTMSPGYQGNWNAYMRYARGGTGYPNTIKPLTNDYDQTSISIYVRPSVTIKSGVIVNGGDGTSTSPYRIS